MKEACDVGWLKLKKHRFCTNPSLPHEIIEDILSRLPVKDLLRFRVVCKQWKANISDPTFAEIHLQHCKNSSSRNLLAWEEPDIFNGLQIAELRNYCIEIVSEIEYVPDTDTDTLCSCDGLYLKYSYSRGREDVCVLWNPSNRTYREFCFPPSVIDPMGKRSIHAMYYDPLTKDYKIVFANMEHYAVYSCRGNKWGEVKEMKGFSGLYCDDVNVFVNGSIYWILNDLSDTVYEDSYEEESGEMFRGIVCFDCKDESFKTLALPNCGKKFFQLTSLGGQLCLFVSNYESYRVKIMKKVTSGDEWMECKEECLWECRSDTHPEPLFQISENELLFKVARTFKMVYMVYDKSKSSVIEIQNNQIPCEYLCHNGEMQGKPIPTLVKKRRFTLSCY